MSGIVRYITDSFEELKTNVSWLTWNEVQNFTITVAVFSILFSLTIWGIDEILSNALSFVLNWLKS